MKDDVPQAVLSEGQPEPRLSQMLCFDIYATNQAFSRFYKPLLDPLGLTYPRYLVLMALWDHDGLTVGQIGRQIGLDSNTLTPLIKKMEQTGLVRRQRSAVDERQVQVMLTDAGRALERQAAGVPACVAKATGMTLAEIQDLQTKLRRLSQGLSGTR